MGNALLGQWAVLRFYPAVFSVLSALLPSLCITKFCFHLFTSHVCNNSCTFHFTVFSFSSSVEPYPCSRNIMCLSIRGICFSFVRFPRFSAFNFCIIVSHFPNPFFLPSLFKVLFRASFLYYTIIVNSHTAVSAFRYSVASTYVSLANRLYHILSIASIYIPVIVYILDYLMRRRHLSYFGTRESGRIEP